MSKTKQVLLVLILAASMIGSYALGAGKGHAALAACGEGWYHTMTALNEALIRLED